MVGIGGSKGIISSSIVSLDPVVIPDLVSYYDGNDFSTITLNLGNVSQWNDKAGANDVVQAGASAQPFYDVTGINGSPSINFDGINDVLTRTSFAGIDNIQEATIFIVKEKTDANAGTYFHFDSTISDGEIANKRFIGGPPFFPNRDQFNWTNTSNQQNSAEFDAKGNSPFVYIYDHVGIISRSFVNGLLEKTNSNIGGSIGGSQRFAIGTGFGVSSNPMAYKIGEIGIYSRKLTDLERAGLNQFLIQKYNL